MHIGGGCSNGDVALAEPSVGGHGVSPVIVPPGTVVMVRRGAAARRLGRAAVVSLDAAVVVARRRASCRLTTAVSVVIVAAEHEAHERTAPTRNHTEEDRPADDQALALRCALLGLLGLEPRLTAGLLTFTLGSTHERGKPTGFRWTGSAVGRYLRPPWPSSCRSTAAPRSPTPTASAPSPSTSPARQRQGNDVVVVVSAMGKETDELIALANQVSTHPARPRDGHAAHRRRAEVAWRCSAWRSPTSASRPSSFTGSQAGIVTDTDARQGQDPRGQGRPAARRRSPTGKVPVVAGFQGVSTDKRRDDARPRRLRHDRRRARRGVRRRRVRDLHRRHRRVHRRPPHRAERPARSAACRSTRCSRWRPPAGGCSRCARSSSPATTTCRCTSARASRGSRARGSPRRMPRWKPRSSPASPTTPREAKVTITGVPDKPGIAARLFRALADESVNVDMIVQNTSIGGAHRHLVHGAEGGPRRRASG